MHFHDLVPTTIFLYLKLLLKIVIFFFGLNLFLLIVNFFNISYIAKGIQDSVRINNYLPEHDYKAWNTLCKDIVKNETKTDAEVYSESGELGIPGINRVITNLKIVVYDEHGNGLNDIDMSKSIMDANTDTDYDQAGVDDYYIGERGIRNKVQMGEILYAGVAFDYHFIVPLFFWDFSIPVYNGGSNLESMFGKEGSGAYSDQANRGRQAIIDNQEKWKVSFGPNSDNARNLFGILPVPCETWYPDINNTTNYNKN